MELLKFIEENRWDYNKNKKVETFFDFEKEYINHIHNNKYSLTVKSRQMYLSSLTILYCVWLMIYEKEINIYFTSNNFSNGKHFTLMLNQILNKLNVSIKEQNKNYIELNNGNKFNCMNTNTNSFVGKNIINSIIIFDEADFINNLEKMIQYFAKIQLNRIIMYSTLNNNFFSFIYKNINNFSKLKLNYLDNPNYNEKWFKEMSNGLGNDENKIKQELLAEFIEPEIKKPKSNIIQFRLDEDIVNKIGLRLIQTDQSISNYIRELINQDLIKNINS